MPATSIGYTHEYDDGAAERLLRLRRAGCSLSMADPTPQGDRLPDAPKRLRRNDTLTVCSLACLSQSFEKRAAICAALAKRGIKIRILDEAERYADISVETFPAP